MRKEKILLDQVAVITAIRKALGLTQEEFARRLGVDRVMISNMERGAVQQPRLTLLPLLVENLGVNPYCLIRAGEPFFLPDAARAGASSQSQKDYEQKLLSARAKVRELSLLLDELPVIR